MSWISVEDGLPAVRNDHWSDEVLITVQYVFPYAGSGYDEEEYRKYVDTARLNHNSVWVDNSYVLIESEVGTKVIGWMPMPEAMK